MTTKASSSSRSALIARTIVTSILVLALSRAAVAQISVDVDFGMRGGVLNDAMPIEAFNNHYFPTGYSTDKLPYAFGPTVGVLLSDRFEARIEAVRSRFRFHGQSGTPFPASGQKFTFTTEGHVWQYPLLFTYHFGTGPVRAFGGGGLSLGRSVHGTESAVITTITPPTPSGVITTTTTKTPFVPLAKPNAYYITGGIEGRVSFISIRPEMRYGRWTSYINDQENTLLFSPNQFEFLVGISLHPFRFNAGHPPH